MFVKATQHFELTSHVKKYILRGQRNARYFDRVLSNKKKSYNINFTSNST